MPPSSVKSLKIVVLLPEIKLNYNYCSKPFCDKFHKVINYLSISLTILLIFMLFNGLPTQRNFSKTFILRFMENWLLLSCFFQFKDSEYDDDILQKIHFLLFIP